MRRLILASILAAIALSLAAAPAAGHERRTIGHYTVEVGWRDEPALAGQLNGVDLTVTDKDDQDKPVEGLESTLKVEVFYGGLSRALALDFHAIEADPGHYAADLIPTKDGSYTFHIFGTIVQQKVDERFESGPNRFDDVAKATALQYPDPVASGADLNATLAGIQSAVDQARILAVAAMVLAIVIPLGTVVARRRA